MMIEILNKNPRCIDCGRNSWIKISFRDTPLTIYFCKDCAEFLFGRIKESFSNDTY